ncbi:MAG: acetolactate synthase large subunit [Rhizobiales bacterium]|nr:acetolactate synthase large subunit [Rhizobacter sp.]
MTKGSDLLVAALENEGVERIFGIPGEENLDVVESLRHSRIELVITRHEQAAGFMAATYGRLTGRPGVCITTLGPGALNLTTAAAFAHVGAMPMVMITGQKGILTSRQARFQIVDIVAAMRPLTKFAHQIVAVGTIPTRVREAFRVAQEERPGPVLLELPEDIAAEACDQVRLVPPHPLEMPIASPAMLDRAAAMIMAAERPLLMLGAAASRPRATADLAQFVLRTGIPYFTTQMGKGVVPGGTALYMGTAALSERDYVHDAIEQADLIVTIGHDTSEKPPFIMDDDRPLVIHVAYQSATVEQVYFPQAEVVGDMGRSLCLLADRLEGKLPRAGALLPLREGILNHLADRTTEDRWTPQRIVHDVRQVMPADGIVALDNGMYKIWFARNYRTRSANTLLLDNALATMGAGLPSAIMAAMLYPGRRVLAVCGDGGFMMNSQELETAVRRKLDLVVLVLVDSAFGMIRWKQAVDGFADFGMTFGNPDFAMYARSYGAHGHNVADVGNFMPTLEAAFRAGGVHLVAVPIDYSENKRVLVDELRDRVPVTLAT